MADQDSIQALKNFINSSVFNSLPQSTQDEIKNNLKSLQEKEKSLAKETVKNALKKSVESIVKDIDIEFSFIVSCDKDKNVIVEDNVKEEAPVPSHVSTPFELTPEPVENIPTRTQSKSIPFSVSFPDGTIIKDVNAKMTFIKTLEKIGLEKLATDEYQKTFVGYNLVGKQKRTDGLGNWQYKIDDWYIYTYMDNDLKMSTLSQISDHFNLGIHIYLEDGSKYIPQTRTINPAQILKVVFSDGEVICDESAVMTFAKSIRKIGLDRVANMPNKKTFSGYYLVDKRKKTDNGKKWQQEIDGWNVFIYMNNQRKALVLSELDKIFNVGLSVYVGDEVIYSNGVLEHGGKEMPNVEEIDLGQMDSRHSTRDTSKYSFNGGTPVNKRKLALQIVREYVKTYPGVNLEQLQEVFVPSITGKNLGVVRSIIDPPAGMSENEFKKRFLLKDDELITLGNQDVITVCSQWNTERIAKMIEIAMDEGWSIIKEGEGVEDEPEIIDDPTKNPESETEQIDVPEPVTPPEPTSRKSTAGSYFGVTFADGSYIEGNTSIDTFLQTLQRIGLSRIPEVDITYGNINLVSAIQKDASKQIAVDGVYVYKDLTDQKMIDALQQISDYYYMDLEIDIEK